MQFEQGNLYHIYNRGNNKNPIFFNEENYFYFLRKVRQYIWPNCHILAYTLMPNHFHFLIEATERTGITDTESAIPKSAMSEGFRLLLSSYTKGVNIQQGFTGNLFQQKTKSKLVHDCRQPDFSLRYAQTCFHYIHQNAYRAALVSELADWAFSSYQDFAGLRNGTLCNQQRAFEIMGMSAETFARESHAAIPEDLLKLIW